MTKQERKKGLVQLLYQRYGSLVLTRKQAAEALNTSTASLDRQRQSGLGPKYIKKKTAGKNGSVVYPADAIAEEILSHEIETT